MEPQRNVMVESSQPPELRDDYPHFMAPTQYTPLSQCPSTIDVSTEYGRAQMLAATGVPDITVDPEKPVRIEVVGYIVYPDAMVNEETGELSEFIRTTLLLADGHTFSTTSEVVLKRLQAIVQLWGRGPWHPPLIVHVMARIGKKNKRLFHDLRVEPREET